MGAKASKTDELAWLLNKSEPCLSLEIGAVSYFSSLLILLLYSFVLCIIVSPELPPSEKSDHSRIEIALYMHWHRWPSSLGPSLSHPWGLRCNSQAHWLKWIAQVAFLHEHGRDKNNALDEETFEREASATR